MAGTEREAEGAVVVDASVERVWRALTEAAELERWFPLEAKVEPGPGGRIWMSWGNEYGSWVDVLAWEPPHHLRTSWSWAEGEAQVTDYRLETREGRTHLRVVTSGFPADASWDDLVQGTIMGWRFELGQLRHYLERHDGEARRASYIRRRVTLAREAAWDRLMGPGGLDLEALGGEAFDRSPPWQYAAVTTSPADGIVRVTIDPSHSDPNVRDVSVFLASWGGAGAELDAAAEAWRGELARLFPEGVALEAEG